MYLIGLLMIFSSFLLPNTGAIAACPTYDKLAVFLMCAGCGFLIGCCLSTIIKNKD